MERVKIKTAFLALALLGFSFFAFAEEYALARFLEGKAFVQAGTSAEREALTINSPIFEGDNIWVTEGNLGIIFSDGNMVWVSPDSHVELVRYPVNDGGEPQGLRMNLWRGSMLLEAKFPVQAEYSHTVVTPAASVRAYRKSLSFIEIESVDRTRLTVLDGSAAIFSGGKATTVWGNQMSYAEYGYEPMAPVPVGDYSNPEIVSFRNSTTGRNVRSPKSWEYLEPELYPYASDLDYYGYWDEVPGYGRVWFPSPAYVYSGWTPYYNGYWRYTPWGSTWVSYDPWGWAPFHYGSWTFVIGVGWGWLPDVFFSPAWVSWYWGDGWVGWCPMGYWGGYWGPLWEPCGWYHVDVNNIYVTNVTKVVSVNKNGPPPVKPIIPVSKAGMNAQGGKRAVVKDGDVIVTPHGGLNLPPAKLQDLQSRKVALDDVKRVMAEPPTVSKDRNVMPTSLDRTKRPGGGAPRSAHGAVSDPSDQPSLPSPRARSVDGRVETPVREPSREPSRVNGQESPDRPSVTREAPSRKTPPDSSGAADGPRTSDRPATPSSPSRGYSTPPPSSPPPSASGNSGTTKQRSSFIRSAGAAVVRAISGGSSGGGSVKNGGTSAKGSGSSSKSSGTSKSSSSSSGQKSSSKNKK